MANATPLPGQTVSLAGKLLPALTGLRFWLALWVILHHLTGPTQHLGVAILHWPHPIYSLIRGGYLAVTTFFVLSGFVLARTYATTVWNGRNILRYGLGRVARVYPVYLLSLLVVAPFIVASQRPDKWYLVTLHLTLIQGWMGTLPVGWNTPAWSLSCEMFFYLMFPLALVALKGAGWWKTLLTAAIACCLTRVMWAAGISDGVKPLVHFADFLMGITAACAYDLLTRRSKPIAGAWLSIPGCLAIAAVIAWQEMLPGSLDLSSTLRPLNAVLLVGLGLGGGTLARMLSTRVMVYLGKSSYAMYILHVPIMWWYARRWRHLSELIYVLVVIAISALVYGLFEEPANRYLRGRIKRDAPSPRPLAASVAAGAGD